MNRITLVNPPPLSVRESHDRPDYPHLGLAYLAASLQTVKSFHVAVVDAKRLRLTFDDALSQIIKTKPDVIGFTAMTHEIMTTSLLAQKVKNTLPHATIFIGGVHATALPVQTLEEFPAFDVAFCGEGETLFPKLLQSCQQNGKLMLADDLCGVALRQNGTIVFREGINRIDDLNTLRRPAFELWPKSTTYPIATGRGCPFHCNFCMRPYGQKVRYRQTRDVIDEINWIIKSFSPEQLIFYDETFTLQHQRTETILEGLMANQIQKKVSWCATTHVNTLTDELALQLKKAGCRRLSLGAESGNKNILKATGKGSSKDSIRRAFKAAHGAGLITEGFFILGHPHETQKTIRQTIQFARELNPTIPVFGIMVPYPGTDIYDMSLRGEGDYLLCARNWNDYNKQIGRAMESKTLSRRTLELYQLWGYVSVFLYNFRFLDFVTFLFHFRVEAMSYLKNMASTLFRKK